MSKKLVACFSTSGVTLNVAKELDDTITSHLSLKSHDYHRWLCSSGYEWTNGKFS